MQAVRSTLNYDLVLVENFNQAQTQKALGAF